MLPFFFFSLNPSIAECVFVRVCVPSRERQHVWLRMSLRRQRAHGRPSTFICYQCVNGCMVLCVHVCVRVNRLATHNADETRGMGKEESIIQPQLQRQSVC